MELISVSVWVCVLFLIVIPLYSHTNMGEDNLEVIFAFELYHVTFVIRVSCCHLANADLFLPVSLERFLKGFVYYRSSINERSAFLLFPPIFLSFFFFFFFFLWGGMVMLYSIYAIVGNFIIVHFWPIRTPFNLPRKIVPKEIRSNLHLSPFKTKVIIPLDYLSHYRCLF